MIMFGVLKVVPGAGVRSAPAPWMPFRAPAHEARRSSRVHHKSTNTAEAHDSERKAPDMQHKKDPNKKVSAPGWLGKNLIRSQGCRTRPVKSAAESLVD